MTATAPTLETKPLVETARRPEATVDPQFVSRWSRRALSERPIPDEHVRSLFEAARWAPSGGNSQPWLFVYASQPESLSRARTLLKESNAPWASRAPLLVFAFARKRHPETGNPLRTAQFDVGAAWQSLALQAHELGLSARAMGGIHHDKTYDVLGVPADEFESVVGIAVGYPGERAELPSDLRDKEQPNGRKSAREFAFEGRYAPRS